MDESTVKDKLRSYVERDEPPMGLTAPQLVARGQRERRRLVSIGAGSIAAVVMLAAVGLVAAIDSRGQFEPARQAEQSLDQRMDELIRSNMPRRDELELKEIKAFRWDEKEPLPESRLDEATSWQADYTLETGNLGYIQQVRVTLGYFPPKQFPPVVDGCSYPGSAPEVAIQSPTGRLARDLRTQPQAGPPLEPGYLVSVDAQESGYPPEDAVDKSGNPPNQPSPEGMTNGYSWEHQLQVATDPDLVFEPPATWPEDVVSPIPLTDAQRKFLEGAGMKLGEC